MKEGMVVGGEMADAHPWVAVNRFKALVRAAEIADAERLEHVEYHLKAGLLPADAEKALRTPLLRHGVVANRRVLETAAQYSNEQVLSPPVMRLDEVFGATTLDQEGP